MTKQLCSDEAIAEVRRHREWQEEQYFLEKKLKQLRESFKGAKVIQVRNHYGDFELILDNAKVIRFDPATVRDL